MIRFIDLRGQITPDNDPEFAFYNTVTDRFVTIGDDQTWQSLADLEESFVIDRQTGFGYALEFEERCKGLIPKNYFDNKGETT